MSTNVVETHGLAKYYGRRRGLESLDMEVRAGEVYGFLGPNGAGKTTAIRVLLDLIRPTAGRAQVFGQSPRAGGAALRRRIGSRSRGSRQKLGLVQAFMPQPELLVLDEPTTGLDPLLQQTFLLMASEARQAGQTVLMSSHVLSEVQQSAARVGLRRAGGRG